MNATQQQRLNRWLLGAAIAFVLAWPLLVLGGCGGGDPEDDRVLLDKPDCVAGQCK